MRRMCSSCCVSAGRGQAAAELATTLMKSRRRIASPKGSRSASTIAYGTRLQQGFATGGMGSDPSFCVATICGPECPLWVNNGHSRSQMPMSALPPKADINRRQLDIRFMPKADVSRCSKNPQGQLTRSPRRRASEAMAVVDRQGRPLADSARPALASTFHWKFWQSVAFHV
jgi:hypothetical protein